jgi:hypothetical protein
MTWVQAAVSAETAQQFATETGIPPVRFTVLSIGDRAPLAAHVGRP